MTLTVRPVHTDRWSPTSHLDKGGVVVHDAESPDGSAQALIDLMSRPGNFPSPSRPGGFYGAAYHAVTSNDPTDPIGYVELLPDGAGPYAAPPVNGTWWHICIPGYARQTREEWLDPASAAGIRGVARYIIAKSELDGFPLIRPTVAQLAQLDAYTLRVGYAGHIDISLAWRQSTHTDPGPGFPWDVLAITIEQLTTEEPDDMQKPIFIDPSDGPGQYVWFPGQGPAIAFASVADRDVILPALGVNPADGIVITQEMLDRLH